MDRLLSEILEQPEVLRRLIAEEYAGVQAIADEIRARDTRSVLIAARGSSANAGTYAQYLLGVTNRLPVALATPSLYTLYHSPPLLQHTLVLAISQSGMSPDVVSVVKEARRQGMLTVAVTNAPASRLAQTAERIVLLHAGEEKSVAATKSYAAQLMAVALLSASLAEDQRLYEQLLAIPDAVAATLTVGEQMAESAERYRYMGRCAIIGRGFNRATAMELALKLQELAYVGAMPFSSADFRHGPIATVEPGFPVFILAPSGKALADIEQLLLDLNGRGAEPMVMSDDEPTLSLARIPVRLPVSVSEPLSPFTTIVPGQMLAYYLARSKGLDPEHPRGLHKVTETR